MKSRRSWRSPNTVVRKSSIHGYGLYARFLILQGEVVGRRGGEVVNAQGAARRDKEWGNFSLQVAADKFLCPRTAADVAKVALFLNHGCNPNAGFRGRFAFVAMRTIDPGDELLIDYAMGKTTPDEWDCTCGSPLCRGVITGDDWKIKELQRRYKGYFTPYVEKLIAREAGLPTPSLITPRAHIFAHIWRYTT